MSLISFRNFLAPFSSKIQIGALLALAFLAFVVRYQSSVDDGDSRPSAPRAQRASSPEQEDLMKALADPPVLSPSGRRKPISDPMLDGALAGDPQGNQGQAEPQQPIPARGNGNSLNDIRKSMGLE